MIQFLRECSNEVKDSGNEKLFLKVECYFSILLFFVYVAKPNPKSIVARM